MTQEEALKALEEMYGEIDKENWLFIGTINPQMVEHAIKALSIVRCKDCKYYQQGRNEWLWCMMNHHYTDEEKYCAWAERKEE